MTDPNPWIFDPESGDLYSWAKAKSILVQEQVDAWWSARFAARKIAMILLTFTREREGQEITPEMLEEMRQLCARVAYD